MKFVNFFRSHAVIKQLLFVLVLFALLIPVAIWDSNSQVKVRFGSDTVSVKCDRYSMSILYADIASAELTELAEPGEPIADCRDDDIILCGVWHNEVWGEYTIVADADATNCVKLTLNDGRILIFNRKNNEATEKDFVELQSFLK